MRGLLVAIVVALSATSVIAAGPARADATDQQYLQVLNANGLGCGQGAFQCAVGDSDMIQVGRAICRQLRGGNSKLSAAQQLSRSVPGLQPQQAATLVAAAKAAYCP